MSRYWPVGIFLLTAFAFLRSLAGGFVWDDTSLVVQTYGFRFLDWAHLKWMFTTGHVANFCPLAWLSYWLDYRLWGLGPAGYHLTNVVLHSLNAVLLYFLAVRLLALAFSEEPGPELRSAAALGALLFALHPLRVESVAWISERRDVLAGLFFLSTLLCYVSGRRAASLAFYSLAVLSKATVVPLPAALLALDLYPLRRRLSWKLLSEKLPYAALAAFAAAMAIRAQHSTGNFIPLARYGLVDRAAQSLYGLGFYLEKTVWPSGLTVLVPLPNRFPLFSAAVAGSLAVLAALFLALRFCRVDARARAALWLYYGAMLLPVLGLLQNGPQLVAGRYSYLSCLGWTVLAAAGLRWCLRRWSARRDAAALAAVAAAGLLLLPAAARTQREIEVWRDNVTLWTEQLRLFPDSWDGHINLAASLIAAHDYEGGERESRAALAADPGNQLARYDLAHSLEERGRLDEATALLRGLLLERDGWGEAHGLLGWTLLKQGDKTGAGPELRRAAELAPGQAQLQFLWGSWLSDRRRAEEGLPFLKAALRLDPGNPTYADALAAAEKHAR